MPTFAELLSQLSFLASTPSMAGALAAAAVIVVVVDWRTSIFALACEVVFAGLLYSRVLPPQVAGVKLMVGLLICVQLFVTARQTQGVDRAPTPAAPPPSPPALSGGGAGGGSPAPRFAIPTGLPFRIIAALMVVVVSWQLSTAPDFALTAVPSDVTVTAFGLVGLGLLGLGLTEEPLKAGMFLITMITGFEMYYAAVEPALAVIALLAVMDFAVALGACYLAVIRALPDRSAAK